MDAIPAETFAPSLVAGAAIVFGLVVLVLAFRALMRMAWLAFVGLTLLAVSLSVILAGEGILPVPDVLRDSFVLGAITGMLLVLWGVVRMLQQAVRPTPAPAR